MTKLLTLLLLLRGFLGISQTAWPGSSWNNATPLTGVMSSNGVTELSGLHWNSLRDRLYAVQGDGRLRVLHYNITANSFSQIADKSLPGGPEGITQRDFDADEFYTVDENNYQIRKYTHSANFSSITLAASWNLLQTPSTMTDTGNAGPEGIVFIPDENLVQTGFTNAQTGQPYTSVKGANGLFFVAHQNGGYVWVFDINPNVSNDFLFIGKYKTARTESCELAFDRSTNLLYILHNQGANYLEVTDLSPAPATGAEPAFTTTAEYFIANPTDGNINVEGFALMPKCGEITGSAFLCRDVESDESLGRRQDGLRRFTSFGAAGTCSGLGVTTSVKAAFTIAPNPTASNFELGFETVQPRKIEIYNSVGQCMYSGTSAQQRLDIPATAWATGLYVVKVTDDDQTQTARLLRN